MARKRGGLAGIWDRNKGWMKYVAPAVAGAIPGLGPLAAAGIGAAMGGLDREGKRGIGIDLGGAARGAATGYGAGQLGAAGAGKLGIGKAAGAARSAVGASGSGLTTVPQSAMTAPPIGALGGGGGAGAGGMGAKLKAAANYAFKENPKVGEYLVGGIRSGMPTPEDEINRGELQLKERQYNDMMEQRRRQAELLLPLWQQMMMGRQVGMGAGMSSGSSLPSYR